jgi:hypothetical protein
MNKTDNNNHKYPTAREKIVIKETTSSGTSSPQEDNVMTNKKDYRMALLKRCWSNIMGDIYADSDPYQFSQTMKNTIIVIVAFSGLMGPVGAMIYMPGMLSVMSDMNTSLTGLNGSVAVYIVFVGIAVSL